MIEVESGWKVGWCLSKRRVLWRRAELLSMALVLAAWSWSGCHRDSGHGPRAGAEMARFRRELKSAPFNAQTAEVLAKLDNYAHRAEGDDALDAWFLLGRTRFDWFLTAVLRRDDRVFGRLVAHLRHGVLSCNKVTQLSPLCRSRLRSALAAPFKKVVQLESSGGHGYSESAREFLSLIDFLVDRTMSQLPAKLVGVRSPAGTRVRIFLACRAEPPGRDGDASRWVSQWWERMLPFPCRMPRTVPLSALQQALLAGRCDYPCRRVAVKPADPVEFLTKSWDACPHDALGFDEPAQARLFTPVSFVATQGLRMLAQSAELLKAEQSDPMVKRFSACTTRLQGLLDRLVLRLPVPAAVKLPGGGLVTLPASKKAGLDPLATLPIVSVGADRGFVGLLPALAPDGEGIQVDKGRKGWVFPGRKAVLSGSGAQGTNGLWKVLSAAMTTEGTVPARGLVIYADRKLKLADLGRLLSILAAHEVPYVRLAVLHGDLPIALAGPRLFLGPAPKGTKKLSVCLAEQAKEDKARAAGRAVEALAPRGLRMVGPRGRVAGGAGGARGAGGAGSGGSGRGSVRGGHGSARDKGPTCCQSHTASRAVAAVRGAGRRCLVAADETTIQDLVAKVDGLKARLYFSAGR